MDIPTARTIRRAGHWTGPAQTCVLSYEARFLRRRRLCSEEGAFFLVDLPHTESLAHGDAFELQDGGLVQVLAAAEELIEVTGPALARLAWHIGNRHTPCQVEPDRLLIQRDHVLRDMLERLGARLCDIRAPFTPEGGAYGHGRTHGHSHGHSHANGQDHAHDH